MSAQSTSITPAARGRASRPLWSLVLRSLRDARGVTQEGWAAWLGYSVATVRRWESGDAVPTAEAERALLTEAEAKGFFRAYDSGPLRGVSLTPELLRSMLAEARMDLGPAHPVTRGSFRCTYPFPLPARLVGRESELERLEQVLVRGRSAGQVALVSGPAGTGKSALIGSLVRRADAARVLCLAGGCYAERGVVPLGPFHDALADYLLAQPPDLVRTELGATLPDLAAVVPELRHHLDLQQTVPLDPARERMRQFGAVLSCLRALAAREPVLVCLDDLQAADAATVHLIHYLARQTRRVPVTVLATFRSDSAEPGHPLPQVVAALLQERLAEQLRLEPLDRTATARLVAALLNAPPSSSLSEWLFDTTEGNPLFIEQLVLALREEGQLDERNGLWHRATSASGARLPAAVRDVIGKRLERLSGHSREVLAMGAVLGQTFEYEALRAALPDCDEASLLGDLEEALSAQLLREAPSGYAFGHALLHEAVYWSLSAPRRTLLHARAGETLERLAGDRAAEKAPELARQFFLAEQLTSVREKALAYSLQAGRAAAATSSYREALLHFSRACELIDRFPPGTVDDATRLAALEGRGVAELELAIWLPCIATCQQVLELARDPVCRARAHGGIGYALHHTDRAAEGLAEVEAGLAELEAAPHSSEATATRVRLQLEQALHWFLAGRYYDALSLGQHMLSIVNHLPDARPRIAAHTATGAAHLGLGQVEQALEHFEAARVTAETADEKIQLAIAYENLGLVSYRAGRFTTAREYLDLALAAYRAAAGWQLSEAPSSRAVNSLQALARVWLAEGDIQRAQEYAELAGSLATEANDRWAAECSYIMASIQSLRADWDTAQTHHERGLAIRRRVGHQAGVIESLLGLGLVRERQADTAGARAWYEAAVEVAAGMDPSPPTAAAQRHLGLLLLRAGDVTSSAELVEQARRVAEAIPQTLEYRFTMLATAELLARTGDLAAALDRAREAVAVGGPAEFLVEAQAALAQWCIERGDLEAAESAATEARGTVELLATPYQMGVAALASARLEAARGRLPAATLAFDSALRHFLAARTPAELAWTLESYAAVLDALPEANLAVKDAQRFLHDQTYQPTPA
jgi:tetratricopeptide (TPR) repeat protein/transcriptional regulator with XRE-family HTH domain